VILAIESDLPTFKSVRFHDGLNVLLSDKSPRSGEKQTRNSAGKSSLVEIVHFLLGSRAGPSLLLRNQALVEFTFRGTFRIAGNELTIARSGSDASKILVDEEAASRAGLKPRKDKKTGLHYISNETWKEFLGHWMFGLPSQIKGSAYEEPFTPSFRSLIAYFARRRGGFTRPEKQAEEQLTWDWQVNLSYLLGLDWRIPFDLQKVRERERQLEELRKAARDGTVGKVIGTVAELRPKVTVAEAKTAKLREDLASFRVLDSYRDMSDRAASIRSDMLAIERRAVSLKQTLDHLQNALEDERAPQHEDLTRLYAAVGVELPDAAKRRFSEVEVFHQSVIENRRARLQEEIAEVESQIADGERRSAELDGQRSDILRFLDGHGALEDFTDLQEKLAALEVEAASLRDRFKAAEMLEGNKTQLDIDRANIKRRLQEDHQARKSKLDQAILLIGRAIGELYEDRTGEFVVDATDSGPEFRITIQGDQGGGISQMEIFCLDLALFFITGKEKRGPGFLIHDSHLFDGVDGRQVAQALQLGASTAEIIGGQYIVTMNSDIFDGLPLLPEIDRLKMLLPTRLSDEGETGGLFGLRFD
jgi:uncharacterized protein YydD (DUF2326 family)